MTDVSIVDGHGKAIIELMRSATDKVLIVAPYIKTKALQRLISAIPDAVSELVCITRWLPEDIASGVCDLEIFDIIKDRPGAVLRVHPHLHAKYYRASSLVMIGSANITARALGWSSPSNVELLVQLPVDLLGLEEWEKRLLDSTVLATEELRDQLAKEAALLRTEGLVTSVPEVELVTQELDAPSPPWFPKCPVPERVWEVYSGTSADTMVRSAIDGAEQDLIALALPKGLSKDLFKAYIASILKQTAIIQAIDKLASENDLSDDQASVFLAQTRGKDIGYGYDDAWVILKHWLTYFFPTEYRVETTQEVLIKGREIIG